MGDCSREAVETAGPFSAVSDFAVDTAGPFSAVSDFAVDTAGPCHSCIIFIVVFSVFSWSAYNSH